jgi:uncharacterized protein
MQRFAGRAGRMSAPVFHEGERQVQARAGVQQRMEQIAPRVIRDAMPDQHRAFFSQLPFLVAGTVDSAGQPWASPLAAPPGFIQSTSPTQLVVNAQPLPGDPLADTLASGADIGLLGIEPHTRRRTRLNGVVSSLGAVGFSVQVHQSFGNCPQYIQAREASYVVRPARTEAAVHRANALDAAARRMIAVADTFYIATGYAGNRQEAGRAAGADVSHRGGKPGFVRVDEDGTLTVPDFLGNFFFNTLGNIAVNPRAGLLFIDYETSDLLYIAVTAEIVWDGPEVDAFAGAQRLLRFKVREVRRVEAALPLRWGAAELSPVLEPTGQWKA